jgi:hypothetical protein
LTGINLSNGRQLANLGSVLLSAIAIVVALALATRTHIKRAAVGRREMQLFLLGFALISLCEIFSVGGFPLNDEARRIFSAIHVAAVTATSWVLLMNAVVGFQLVEDGTVRSVGGIMISSAVLFVGTGYIALDTGFSWTNYFKSSLDGDNLSYWLYTLFLLLPLVCIVLFYLLELFLVLRVLAEIRPLSKSAAFLDFTTSNMYSMAHFVRAPICYWTDFPIHRICSHMYRHEWKDKWRILRSSVYAGISHHGMGVLVLDNRR